MSKEIVVSNCWEGCPFANQSISGKRLYISCTIQRSVGSQWRAEMKNYKCFDTCPLKKEDITVKVAE